MPKVSSTFFKGGGVKGQSPLWEFEGLRPSTNPKHKTEQAKACSENSYPRILSFLDSPPVEESVHIIGKKHDKANNHRNIRKIFN